MAGKGGFFVKKKGKRILAWGIIVFLLGLYALTLFAALFDRSETKSLFQASVFCTIVFPVLIYVYLMIYRLFKK